MKMTYLTRPSPGCKPESNTIAWADVERLTRNQLGRTIRSTCPICSEHRSPANRRARCFAVRLKDPDFAIFNCLNCGISCHVRPDTPARVIDFAEQQRLRNEARRRDEDDRAERTESALRVWKQRRPFRGSPAEDYLYYTRGIGDWLDVFPYLDEAFGFHPKCTFGSDRLPSCWHWSATSKLTPRSAFIALRSDPAHAPDGSGASRSGRSAAGRSKSARTTMSLLAFWSARGS